MKLIQFKSGCKTAFINPDQVIYVEQCGDEDSAECGTKIRTTDGYSVYVNDPLASVVQRLTEAIEREKGPANDNA